MTDLLDEITIVEYDPRWPALYEEERLRILRALEDSPQAVEHMGSTAVRRLAAKPIIDIMAGVHGAPLSQGRMAALEAAGYGHWRDNGPWWGFCRRGAPRTHHLHLIDVCDGAGQAHWGRQLLFRDYLRSHPDEGRRYEALKRRLARRFPTDWRAYEEHKTDFVEACLEKAKQQSGPAADQAGLVAASMKLT